MFNKIILNFYYKRIIKEDVASPALVKAPPHRMPTYKQMGHKHASSVGRPAQAPEHHHPQKSR